MGVPEINGGLFPENFWPPTPLVSDCLQKYNVLHFVQKNRAKLLFKHKFDFVQLTLHLQESLDDWQKVALDY